MNINAYRKWILIIAVIICYYCFRAGIIFVEANTNVIDQHYKNLDQYIQIGEYKNIDLVEQQLKITAADLETEINHTLLKYADEYDVKDRKSKKTDLVVFDYRGKVQGSGENITGEEVELELGADEFDQSFERHLFGVRKGDTLSFKKKFSSEFSDLAFAGKLIQFHVTIKNVRGFKRPILDDRFVKETFNCDSVGEYKKQAKKELYESELYLREEQRNDNLLSTLVNDAVSLKEHKPLYKARYQELEYTFRDYAKLNGVEFENVLKELNISNLPFDEYVSQLVKEELVIAKIAQQEGLFIKKKDYDKKVEALVKEFDYSSADEFIEDTGEEYVNRQVLRKEVLDYVYRNADIKEIDIS